ncbi:MAG: glycosyltransferase family 4 protein [Gemmatimonadales bacterium]
MIDEEKRLCFVSLEAYPLMNPDYGHLKHGGEGVQHALLAHAFATRGFGVHLVTMDYGQPDGEVIDGVRVWKAYSPSSGIPVLRFLHPRASGLLRALARADATVYYQSCAGVATGIIAWFCRRHGRRFVFRLASDTDCIPGGQIIRYRRDRKVYEYGLRRADVVLAQSTHQQTLLMQHYGLDSQVAGMPAETVRSVRTTSARDIDLLWVANIRPFKRPELALALARRMPETRFHMVGGACEGNTTMFNELRREAASISNLSWRGFRPYRETQAMFARARIFLSTSDTEGFPNTYLQAWMAGTPVVAFFDPDGIIGREGLGMVVASLKAAAWAIQDLLGDLNRLREMSERVRAYAVAHHGATVIGRYEELLAPLFGEET